MKVLVTGDTGFKGAWLSLLLQHRGHDVVGIALPPEDPRGAYASICDHDHRDVDIRDVDAVRAVLSAARPDLVLHLAAQALVRRSYEEPTITYATNVLGTSNVLESLPTSVGAVVVVTSDKVYRHDGLRRPFVESDPLGGADPYSASKACTEHVVAAWATTASVPVATARAGNVIGGGDRALDRLVPDVVRAAEGDTVTHVRHPDATRPWQHVLDPLDGYLRLAEALLSGDAPPSLNFGPAESATVRELLDRFIGALGRGSWIEDTGSHPPEMGSLSLDATLARATIGWMPKLDLQTSVELTARWYDEQLAGGDLRSLTLEQIEAYR